MIVEEELNGLVNKEESEFKNKNRKKNLTGMQKLANFLIQVFRWIELKVFALISVLIGGGVTYYSNFFKVIYNDERIDNFYFDLSLFLYSIGIGIMIYLCIYLPYFKNIHEDKWDSYCPNMIPIASFCGLTGMITLIISIWPVWGWISLPLVLFIKWGFVMTVNFAPGGTLGSLVFIIILTCLLVSGYYIEHEGKLH